MNETRLTKLTIGRLAKSAGVNVETIRYYERRQLIDRPRPVQGAYREYPAETIGRIQFVKRAQQLGFTLSEVRELLVMQDVPNSDRTEVRDMAIDKLSSIEGRIADLQRMSSALSKLVHSCRGRGPISGCPIIESLLNSNDTTNTSVEHNR